MKSCFFCGDLLLQCVDIVGALLAGRYCIIRFRESLEQAGLLSGSAADLFLESEGSHFSKLVQFRCDYEVRVGFKETVVVSVGTVGIIVAFRQRAEPCPPCWKWGEAVCRAFSVPVP